MATSERGLRRPVIAAATLLCGAAAACTFEGLGNYEIKTCARPLGVASDVQQTGVLAPDSDLTFVSTTGATPTGAFVTQDHHAVLAVQSSTQDSQGYLGNAAFFSNQKWLPRQPWLVPMPGGYAVAAIATTAPCNQGQISFEYVGNGVTVDKQSDACESAGTALPSIVPLADGALLTWYETAWTSRSDPIASCSAAQSAPLVAAFVSGATTSAPKLGKPVMLSATGTSIRPAAVAVLPNQPQVLVAAPSASAVDVWSLDASLSPAAPMTIPGLQGARAVFAAAANDGSGRIAVVAEIGCVPQTIKLAVGTLAQGFQQTTIVAAPNADAAVEPTVAWVPSEARWIVSWISTAGGAHALAQRFSPNGTPFGEVIVPATLATGACVGSDATLLAYVPTRAGGGFVNVSLGCVD